jgi:hypothetical protein
LAVDFCASNRSRGVSARRLNAATVRVLPLHEGGSSVVHEGGSSERQEGGSSLSIRRGDARLLDFIVWLLHRFLMLRVATTKYGNRIFGVFDTYDTLSAKVNTRRDGK